MLTDGHRRQTAILLAAASLFLASLSSTMLRTGTTTPAYQPVDAEHSARQESCVALLEKSGSVMGVSEESSPTPNGTLGHGDDSDASV